MHLTTVDEAGRLDLGDVARALGYRPGVLVQVIRTSADTLILAINDDPLNVIEATGQRLPAPQEQRALTRRSRCSSTTDIDAPIVPYNRDVGSSTRPLCVGSRVSAS